MGNFKPVPVDRNARRLVDRGSSVLVDSQSIGASFTNVVIGLDCKGFLIEVLTGALTVRGVEPCSVAHLAASAVVDATGGKVDVASTAHGFTIGDSVTITGTTNYNGTYVLQSGGTVDLMRIIATYHAETTAVTAYAVGYRDITLAAGTQRGWPCAVEALQPLVKAKGAATIQISAWR